MGRYQGSVVGLAWSLLNPFFMLTVYTFVFSVVFRTRWGGEHVDQSRTLFAMLLFTGMIMHGLIAEMLTRSPTLVVGNVNYVKKVVFPLEVLPIVTICASLFHTGASLLVLLAALMLFNGEVHLTVLLLPLILMPLLLVCVGIGWLLASLGVYLRDVAQTTGLLSTVLMFLSPVFYPVSALPAPLRPWMLANPLTFVIEQARAVMVFGQLPDWRGLGVATIAGLFVAWLGFFWFQKTRRGFADVL